MRRSSDLDNIGLSCRLNRLNKHSRWDKWQDKVSFCSLIRFNWRVPARVPLFSLGLKAHRSGPFGHSGRLSEVLLTHYRRREVRNSIYRYREIHIDYRSKFSYRLYRIYFELSKDNQLFARIKYAYDFVVPCFVVVALTFLSGFIRHPYASGLLHWHQGNHMIASVPVK